MLLVELKIAPHGDLLRTQTLGVIRIVNDGTGDEATGNYDALVGLDGNGVRRVRIEGHDRTQRAWALVRQALEQAGY